MRKTGPIIALLTAVLLPINLQQAWSTEITLDMLNTPKNPSYHILEPINEKNCSFKTKKKCLLELSQLKRAYRLKQEGDIRGFCLVLEYLAVMKSKHGAYGLGNFYSAEYIATLKSFGPAPNLPLSYKWLRKAASLGHKGAIKKLKELQ